MHKLSPQCKIHCGAFYCIGNFSEFSYTIKNCSINKLWKSSEIVYTGLDDKEYTAREGIVSFNDQGGYKYECKWNIKCNKGL